MPKESRHESVAAREVAAAVAQYWVEITNKDTAHRAVPYQYHLGPHPSSPLGEKRGKGAKRGGCICLTQLTKLPIQNWPLVLR